MRSLVQYGAWRSLVQYGAMRSLVQYSVIHSLVQNGAMHSLVLVFQHYTIYYSTYFTVEQGSTYNSK